MTYFFCTANNWYFIAIFEDTYNIHINFSWYVFFPFCTFPLHFLIWRHRYCGRSLFFSFLARFLPSFHCGGTFIFFFAQHWPYIECTNLHFMFSQWILWCNLHIVIRAWIILRVVDALHYFSDIFINASGNDTEPWMCDIGNNNSRCITCNAWWEVFASSCCG